MPCVPPVNFTANFKAIPGFMPNISFCKTKGVIFQPLLT